MGALPRELREPVDDVHRGPGRVCPRGPRRARRAHHHDPDRPMARGLPPTDGGRTYPVRRAAERSARSHRETKPIGCPICRLPSPPMVRTSGMTPCIFKPPEVTSHAAGVTDLDLVGGRQEPPSSTHGVVDLRQISARRDSEHLHVARQRLGHGSHRATVADRQRSPGRRRRSGSPRPVHDVRHGVEVRAAGARSPTMAACRKQGRGTDRGTSRSRRSAGSPAHDKPPTRQFRVLAAHGAAHRMRRAKMTTASLQEDDQGTQLQAGRAGSTTMRSTSS